MSRTGKGRSSYAAGKKNRKADYYGSWSQGKRLTPEVVAGTTLNYTPGHIG